MRVDDARVQALVARHYEMVCVFWVPDRAAYVGLGQGYVESPEFRERYDRQHSGLAEYLRDAMAIYAEVRLS